MFPLEFAKLGERLTIVRMQGNEATRRHLEELGFTVGSEISITQRMGANVIVSVKESRVAISREMANKIFVA